MKFDIQKPQVLSEIGRKTIQEDSVWPAADKASIYDRLFIVSDGMGGKDKGNVASETVTKAVADSLFQNTCPDEPLTNDLLRTALVSAYEQLGANCPDGVGTSVAFVYMHRKGCTAVHIGDCRIYQIRPSANALLYKSADDFKLMMSHSTNPVSPEVVHLTNVRPGDYFFICTKSMTAHLTDSQVVSIVASEGSDGWKRRLLRERCEQVEDNHSCILVQVSGVMTETADIFVDKSSQPKTGNSGTRPQQAPVVEEPERKKGFPIVAVSAVAIVLLGCLLWWWMMKDTGFNSEPEPVVVEKKDTVKEKDTLKIIDSKTEVKKDTVKKAVEPSYRQKADSLLNSLSDGDNIVSSPGSAAQDEQPIAPTVDNKEDTQPSDVPSSQEPAPAQQPAANQTQPNGGVTPRPVIPDE